MFKELPEPDQRIAADKIVEKAGFTGDNRLLDYAASRVNWQYPTDYIDVLDGTSPFNQLPLMGNFGNPSHEDCVVLSALLNTLPKMNDILTVRRANDGSIGSFIPEKTLVDAIQSATSEKAKKIVADAGLTGNDAAAQYLAQHAAFRVVGDDAYACEITREATDSQIVLRALCNDHPDLITLFSIQDSVNYPPLPMAFDAQGKLKELLTVKFKTSPDAAKVTVLENNKINPGTLDTSPPPSKFS